MNCSVAKVIKQKPVLGITFAMLSQKLQTMIRKCLAFFLASLLALSGVGMPVFTHVCNGMGKSWSALFAPPKQCCERKEAVEKGHCQVPPASGEGCQMEKKSCCENHFFLAALSEKFTAQSQPALISMPVLAVPVSIFEIFQLSLDRTGSQPVKPSAHAPPPLRHGRSLLIFEQTFLC